MMEKIRSYFKSCFSNSPNRTVIICVVVALTMMNLAFIRKTVIVSVDGKQQKVVTYRSTYKQVLMSNNIEVGKKDKVAPSLDSRVVNGGNVSVRKAVALKVEVDGKTLDIKSAESNVEKMLEAEGIGLQDFDKVSPSKDVAINNGLKVQVVRVKAKDIKENKTIDFSTVVKSDQDVEAGNNKITQQGQPGEKEVVTRVVYEDGKEVSRKVIGETIKKNPIQKIIVMGALNTFSTSRGNSVSYSKTMTMRATAYTAYGYKGGGAYTASGTLAKRNQGGYSSAAVDPRVIPLGTKLYVEGYGYAIAEDTGGAVKGNTIDLYFNSESEANNWGVRPTNVYIVK